MSMIAELVRNNKGWILLTAVASAAAGVMNMWLVKLANQYAVGIEPCSNGFGRELVEAAGELIWLEPGDRREYDLEVGILDGAEEIAAFRKRVNRIIE